MFNLINIWIIVTSVFLLDKSVGIEPQKKWQLVWSDEFNRNGAPDSTKWAYETGFVRDYEKQYYTKRAKNVIVKNGFLRLTAQAEEYVNPQYVNRKLHNQEMQRAKRRDPDSVSAWLKNKIDSTVKYTSGSLITFGKASWKYCKVTVRAKLPSGSGVWPIIWMMGTNRKEVGWPKCGEIDIMEHSGKNPAKVYGNFHFQKLLNEGHSSQSKNIVIQDLTSQFHIYEMIWNERSIKLSVDGNIFNEFDIASLDKIGFNPFRRPFYLLINFPLGGAFGGDLEKSILPQQFLIDYVRVYQ